MEICFPFLTFICQRFAFNYNAHDSLEDCRALAALNERHIFLEFMIDSSFTYEYALSKCRYRIQKDVNLQSLLLWRRKLSHSIWHLR